MKKYNPNYKSLFELIDGIPVPTRDIQFWTWKQKES